MDYESVKNYLVSEIKLSEIQAKVFLLVVVEGKMDSQTMAEKLKISNEQASLASKQLIDLGGFIEFSKTEYETMHPRFTAVNMYRRMCEKENIEFKRNKIVDNIGVALEKPYDYARTK